ncbi:hypothetical protein Herbaro_09245 [Herbaspirillum sp. WKF16]|uniref:hypothetical protein n=1 Tax=Herbaspirillum sp. WKF16 TaxID=3028312 RepID=UPI0023A9CDBE|nr:hypothetical protein [Herbaspirillum sp. WKF16]WDZ97945.1 hypothetical protein Herbaro_09245 [Herbaspirillum sp. WKF16]
MKAATITALTLLVIGILLFMTDADRRAEEAGELLMNTRLVHKFPAVEVAELGLPLAGGN